MQSILSFGAASETLVGVTTTFAAGESVAIAVGVPLAAGEGGISVGVANWVGICVTGGANGVALGAICVPLQLAANTAMANVTSSEKCFI